MSSERSDKVAFCIAVLAAAVLAWALSGALASAPSGASEAKASPRSGRLRDL